MSQTSSEKAFASLENKRLAAKAAYLKKRDDIYAAVPLVKDLTDEILSYGAEKALAILAKDTAAAQAAQEKLEKAEKDRNLALVASGYTPEDIRPVYYCPICKDTGYVNGRMCSCVKKEMQIQRQRELEEKSPMPKCTFEGFDLSFYSKQPLTEPGMEGIVPFDQMRRIFDYCKAYAQYFSKNNDSLFMYGTAGLGKTHLACAIAREIVKKGGSVMYASAQSLFSRIEQARYTDEDILSQILDCDLFILDDLGAENKTGYGAGVLYNIINTRMIRGLPSVYTSNILTEKEMLKRYGEKISSRLFGGFTTLFFVGEDIRKKKKLRDG